MDAARPLLEVAVDSLADALSAAENGADRLELCSALDVGGLTPSAHVIRDVVRRSRLPVVAMVRPRAGSFVVAEDEIVLMLRPIALARDAGATGVVFGAITPQRAIDKPACARLLHVCRGLEPVFHRAFDECTHATAALDELMSLGFARVLTSGGGMSAAEPSATCRLRELHERSAGRIEILPGGGVRSTNAAIILRSTGARQLHSSCRVAGEFSAVECRKLRAAMS